MDLFSLLALFVLAVQCAEWRGRTVHAKRDGTLSKLYVNEWDRVEGGKLLADFEWELEYAVQGDVRTFNDMIVAEHTGYVQFKVDGNEVKKGRPIFTIQTGRPRITKRVATCGDNL